ncbi:interleukin-27 subunit beta-like [Carassius auratus]|uniref:Interleukin-27 subunit beta-like n=1 Tax=Carassius auratus TaxID=7957 RepID=A0A6P6N7E2_CARAU|nr:interleukin-27 subunit beta-like [Carassius auratus]
MWQGIQIISDYKSSNSTPMFGDDTTVIGLIRDNNETANREEVQHLAAWCTDNNLLLNTMEPDPPVNVSVMVMADRKLSVEWGPSPTWPDPFNFLLKYTMKFHWGKPETARTSSTGSNKMVLSGLVAGRTYYIQISAKDSLDDGQSSEWSTPINATIPTVSTDVVNHHYTTLTRSVRIAVFIVSPKDTFV